VTTALYSRLGDRVNSGKKDPRLVWQKQARPDQLLPAGRWRVWYIQGGRGSGKTRSGAGALAEWVLGDTDGEGEYGIIGPTYADAWTKCVEGESGILRALGTSMAEIKDHRSATVRSAWRTYGQVVMHNGIVIYIDSAAEGGLRIQGRNLKGAWCDEIGLWFKWELAWNESLRYAVRMGISRIVATGTPKASQPSRKLIRGLIKDLPEHGGVVRTRLRTEDNRDNLSEEFYRAVIGANRGTRLERQELEGELLDDVANSLWERELLERIQVPALGKPGGPADLNRVFIGVDPSDGAEDSDEQAYTVAGLHPMGDPRIYVVESWGGQESPAPFARRVISKAVEYNGTLVVEKNHGGGWLKATFAQVQKDMGTRVPVRLIHASQAKRSRAEPVAAMYERNHGQTVFHAAPAAEHFIELEDQMCIAAGTLVETSRGRIPVEQVRPLDCVATTDGWLPVMLAGPQPGLRETLTIETSRGPVTCTPDHPVYVFGRGMTRADEVQTGDILQSCLGSPSDLSLSSGASATTWTMTGTTRPADLRDGDFCIARSGRTATIRKSRTAGMFIMEVSGVATMIPATSLPFLLETTTGYTEQIAGTRSELLLTQLAQEAGSAGRSGRGGRRVTTSARSAGSRTSQGRTNPLLTARGNAVTGLWDAVVLSVRASGERRVYDLSVGSHDPEYQQFFAGGLLVHNCTFTGAQGERSPDRLDSLVWTLTPYLSLSFGPPEPVTIHSWAAQAEMGELAGNGAQTRAKQKLASAHGGLLSPPSTEIEFGDGWDFDSFAPQEDTGRAARMPDDHDAGPRPNVHRWR
jgi:predicted phage terminase large subunit-like protein